MRRYPWPGNVRELENAIERAVVVGKSRQIQLNDLPFAIVLGGAAEVEKSSLEEMERQHIARVLATEAGNLSNVARILRINRSTLYAKIKKYGFLPDKGHFRGPGPSLNAHPVFLGLVAVVPVNPEILRLLRPAIAPFLAPPVRFLASKPPVRPYLYQVECDRMNSARPSPWGAIDKRAP